MRKKRRTYLAVAALSVIALLLSACGGDGSAGGDTPDGPPIQIGSVNFAENRILAEMYHQVLEHSGYDVPDVQDNIGAREVVAPALDSGDLDFIVEYTGNGLLFEAGEEDVELREPQEVYDAYQEALAEKDLVALAYSDAQDVDGLMVTPETAEEFGLETISDIGTSFEGTFRFGAGPECEGRISCLDGYREIYGFSPEEFEYVPLDTAGPISVQALNSGEVDGANLFTTQGVVAANDFVTLEDDRQMQLPQNIVPVMRQEIVDAYGDDFVELVDSVTASLTTENLTELNAMVEVDQEDPEDVAEQFLEDNGFLD